jgi:ribonucleases P/MRP protein subunit RPP40
MGLTLTDFIFNKIDCRNGKAGAVFVDLQNAFDSVPILPLLQKLKHRYNVSPSLLAILSDYFLNRQMFINLPNYSSDFVNLLCGDPQGSILSPLLFILYIEYISDILSGIPYLLYADDLVFNL